MRIIHLLLMEKELTISDLEHILDFTQTKTSRHVMYLKHSGLVNVRKEDQWVFYSIKEEVSEIVSQMIKFLQKDDQLIRDLEVYKIMDSNRELAANKLARKEYQN